MSDVVLSQQEIDNLLKTNKEVAQEARLTEAERDVLGEVGNISMATAATALSKILSEKVEITAPQVTITTLAALQEEMDIPNVILQVKFTKGLKGSNVLLMGLPDASIIANLMMGGDGKNPSPELSAMELSAVSEAMNQMIGSASTSLATIMNRNIDITPPNIQIWWGDEDIVIDGIESGLPVVKVAFRMTVNNLIDSQIMQIFNLETVKDIANSLIGESVEKADQPPNKVKANKPPNKVKAEKPPDEVNLAKKEVFAQPVAIQKPVFGEFKEKSEPEKLKNIDLIMDVPLEFSAILGKTTRTIREVLSLSPGSVVELNKLEEEPLDVYVNGKLLAQGEVVVINENFGIRITNIISASERVKNLK